LILVFAPADLLVDHRAALTLGGSWLRFLYQALNDLGGLAANQLAAVNCPPEETAMWTLLAFAAAASFAFGLIAVGPFGTIGDH